MNRIVVFCGSSMGTHSIFEEKAKDLGHYMALNNIDLVYGGAEVGLMGVIANAVLAHGGKAIGVLPKFLRDKELAHNNLTELILVDTMHERKAKMNELCDGVIVLPGGFGTLEELFEMLTWAQLGLHNKPIGILNINGFYNELFALMDTMIEKGFLKSKNKELILVSEDVGNLITKMQHYKAPLADKWIIR